MYWIVNSQCIDQAKLLGNSKEPKKQTLVMANWELQTAEKMLKMDTITNGQMLLSSLPACI